MLGTNAACMALVLFVALSPTFYNRSLMSFSAVLYSESQHHLSVEEIAATTDVVFATDGVNGSVAVTRSDNDVTLRVNGKADASSADARTQLLLGHLGATFHPAPHRVLVIGFGSGMTISAVARYPDVERIDCVEIEPAVLRAATFFEALNHGVLKDPRVHIIFDDARNFLLTSREKYDLIISEPSNPWIAGIASLFTDEFYRAAQQMLENGGIFVQWVQAYSLAPADLRMILATFAARFPEVSMWRGEELDFLLLGTTEKLTFDFNRLRAFWLSKGIRLDFESLNVHQPEALIAYYLLPDVAVRKLADHSPLNTDDKTLLEYHAPQTLLRHSLGDDNLKLVASVRAPLPPPELGENDVEEALASGVMTALDVGDTDNIANFFNASEFPRDSAAGFLAKGRFALVQGDLQGAKSELQRAARLDLETPDPELWLAIAEHRLGNERSAQLLIDGVLTHHPNFLPALQEKTQFAIDRSDFQTALHTELEKIDLMDDPPASEYCGLGVLLTKLSHVFSAEVALLKGLAKDPYSYRCHLELGELYLETGKYSQARQMFEWLVRFFPDSDPRTFRSLTGVDLMLGDLKAAKLALNKGRRIFANDRKLQAVNSGLNER
jgi:spermidine synthase